MTVRSIPGVADRSGAVLRTRSTATETVLYSFAWYIDGGFPTALTQGRDGNFYGTTVGRGTSANSTVFGITPAGVESILDSVALPYTGNNYPIGALVQASDGQLYGITESGGTNGVGAIFTF